MRRAAVQWFCFRKGTADKLGTSVYIYQEGVKMNVWKFKWPVATKDLKQNIKNVF